MTRAQPANLLPWVAVVAAIALVGSHLVAWSSVRGAVRAAHESEADALLDRLHHYLHRPHGPPDLDSFLTQNQANGLRFVSLTHRGETFSAGVSQTNVAPTGGKGAVEENGVVFAWRRPPPMRPNGPPPPRARPREPALHALEFEPVLGVALQRDALTGFLISGVAAVLTLLLSFALRRLLRSREEALREAEHRRRLASLGEMAAVLAHEIRNPLASLKGHAQLLEETATGTTLKKAERIVAEAQRLDELTRHLLEFVRTGALRRTGVDLRRLCEEVARPYGDIVQVDGSASASVDASRMRQAVQNLVVNALDASPDWVRVVVATSERAATIEVADQGPGLPAESDELFEPFRTFRTSGTGLGLAIVKRIVDAHGGSVRAERREAGGASFVITLPFAEGPRG
ncbi:MAG: ATP-binding protein [Myxococcota bacterium]